MLSKKFLLSTIFLIAFGVFFASPASAADPKPTIRDSAYAAKYVDQTIADPINITAGETVSVDIRFKNVGTATWARGGRHVSGYTEIPRYRPSPFATNQWVSTKQTDLMQPRSVAPGQMGTITIELKAPDKPGKYREEFHLAAENYSWIKGGYFYLDIVVNESGNTTITTGDNSGAEEIDTPKTPTKPTLDAAAAFISKRTVAAKGGEQVRMTLTFKNKGTEAWSKYGLVTNRPTSQLASTNNKELTFADATWKSHSLIVEKSGNIGPDGTIRESFYFRAPRERGVHIFSITPIVNGEVLTAGVDIEVTVTEDAPSHYKEPTFTNKNDIEQKELRLSKEPYIRVGIKKNPVELGEALIIKALDADMGIMEGELGIGILKKGQSAKLSAGENGTYTFVGAGLNKTGTQHFRLEPIGNKRARFEATNLDRNVTWRGARNFNVYRGAAEYRKTDDGRDNYYLINELLFEDYIAGIAEASNIAPTEFLKAQAVVARTYAYYIQQHSNKHVKRHFHVQATTADQLYLGYNNEIITPNAVRAAKQVRGVMVVLDKDRLNGIQDASVSAVTNDIVAYDPDNVIVITPYFGNSDGRTRDWTAVWGGSSKPWLVSVTAEYDKGKRLFGHGVGMSQRDAAYRAEKQGASWQELITHYYTGVSLERVYR